MHLICSVALSLSYFPHSKIIDDYTSTNICDSLLRWLYFNLVHKWVEVKYNNNNIWMNLLKSELEIRDIYLNSMNEYTKKRGDWCTKMLI